MAPRLRLTAFHIELLEFLRQFGWATGQQAALWTGAHGSTVKKSLYKLKESEMVARSTVTSYTNTTGTGRLDDLAVISVWHLTRTGAHVLGPIDELPGSGAPLRSLPVIRSVGQSATIAHHLACVDHAITLRMAGAQIVSERQIRATETEVGKRLRSDTDASLRATRHWVAVAGTWSSGDPIELGRVSDPGPASHTPDIGALWPDDGLAVRVEVELARKDTLTYLRAIHSMYGTKSVPTQWWFPAQAAARENLIVAAKKLTGGGPVQVDGRTAWWASNDDRIRIYGSLWFGGHNTADLAKFDPRAIYPTMLDPRTRQHGEQFDPRRLWMVRPDVAALASRTKAARATRQAERDAAEQLLVRRALAQHLAPGVYDIDGVGRTWDGSAWSQPDLDSLWDDAA